RRFVGANREDIRLTIGDHDKTDDKTGSLQLRFPKKIISHKHFNKPVSLNNDIGLVELDSPVNISHRIRHICLPNIRFIDDNFEATIASWGRSPLNPTIKLSKVETMRNRICMKKNTRYWNYKTLQPGQMCSQPKGNAKKCWAHRGAGVMIYENRHWILIGLASSDNGCGDYPRPQISTRISEYIGWIKKNVKKATSCKDGSDSICMEVKPKGG
ncbi:unnamed protein product, partial [Meganyctiphanes norvegica]